MIGGLKAPLEKASVRARTASTRPFPSDIRDHLDQLEDCLLCIDPDAAFATITRVNGWLQNGASYKKEDVIVFYQLAVATYRLHGKPDQERYFHVQLNDVIRSRQLIRDSDREINRIAAHYHGGIPLFFEYMKMLIMKPFRRQATVL